MGDGRRRLLSGHTLLGGLLVLIGLLALLDQLDLADLGDIVSTWWPLVLIVPGAVGIVQGRGRGLGAYLLLFFGVGFLLERLAVIPDDWLRLAWPILLILVGVSVALPRLLAGADAEGEASGDEVSVFALMGGAVRRATSDRFRGGEATAVMGGVELDLAEATPVAEGATLRAFALMGGIEIRVPDTWVVELSGLPLMGAIEDSRRSHAPASDDAPRLRVVGTAVMGGVEVKSSKDRARD